MSRLRQLRDAAKTVGWRKTLATEYQVRKAKAKKRKLAPWCAVCDCERDPVTGRQLDVHHKVPVHVNPDLACVQSNLAVMCRVHHQWVGHPGGYRTYNSNWLDTVACLRSTHAREVVVSRKPEEST
jgi:hypothetical protein